MAIIVLAVLGSRLLAAGDLGIVALDIEFPALPA
jgi:hypothetical protein